MDKVSQLPTSILDAGEDVLQSFVRDEVFSATANNVPFEVLNDNSMRLNRYGDADWILRNGYKVWGKKIKMDIDDNLASSIRTRRGETLSDVLHNFQGWDRKTPIPAVIYVFEATPLTRLRMIARDYVGGTSYDKIRQIIRLGPKAATLLIKEPKLQLADVRMVQ